MIPPRTQGIELPTLSVVVAAYNIADFIGACLDSLVSETYGDYEVIVVDDGSTDATLEILADRSARYPQLRIIQRENGGLGAARNTGIAAASGKYLTFVDGDDWVEPGYIETCLAEISAHPEIELWVFDYIDVTSHGRQRQACADDFWSCRNAAWNKIYRRELIGGERFDEDILYEDLAAVRPWVARANHKRYLDRALYNYRNLRKGSIMSSVDTTRFFDLFTAADRCVERIECSLGADRAQALLGADWRRRFYTSDVFMPGLVDWPRKIAEAPLRRRYAAEFTSHLNENTDGISKSLLARDFGLKIALAALCYEYSALGAGDFLLHRMGRMKRRLTSLFSGNHRSA
ncbi:glycosyltransferase family 2 protein [Salinisphaera sp. SWV1]|uniref:glycosyltransferase family 2 protein n=1 Tax=Salinisphaera sp. SWV1 TaxID=3454139 RepID=UPI003F836AF5